MYCPNHQENELIQSCRQHLSREALKDIFCFTYDRMLRYQGAWHLERQRMFPHYVFLESENSGQLRKELEEYRNFATVLEDKELLFPVRKEEEELLRRICGETHHLGMSKGYIRDGQACVTEGPLRGQERLIRKIDRHKRLARLAIPCEIQRREMVAGLEIISKS